MRTLIWVKEPRGAGAHGAPMPQDAAPLPGLYCEDLPPDQAGTVFPLLREAIPGLLLPAWLRFARRVTSPRRAGQSGIMVVRRAPRPMPCGLFLWRRDEDLAHGAVLVAEHLVAIDLLDSEPVMASLVMELERLAQRLACGGIRTMVIRPDAPIATSLLAAGHASEGAAMWKPVDAPQAPTEPLRKRR